jgi:GT2 family glycosyltransferase
LSQNSGLGRNRFRSEPASHAKESAMKARIAVLVTSFNRREKTLKALQSVYSQDLAQDVITEVYLLDDNSSDGTREAVQSRFPNVRLSCGDGLRFWNGGMRIVFEQAIKEDFDHYILLNDDVHIEPSTFRRLIEGFETLRNSGQEAPILVGSFRDAASGALTYGGVVRSSRIHPLKFRIIAPSDRLQKCDTFNGNCVLIPRSVVARVGNLSPAFQHGMADFDYGLRARAAGCCVWIVPGFVGTCSHNSALDTRNPQFTFAQRWRAYRSIKGLPPNDWHAMAQRHGGLFWPVFFVFPYVRFFIEQLKPPKTHSGSEVPGK